MALTKKKARNKVRKKRKKKSGGKRPKGRDNGGKKKIPPSGNNLAGSHHKSYKLSDGKVCRGSRGLGRDAYLRVFLCSSYTPFSPSRRNRHD